MSMIFRELIVFNWIPYLGNQTIHFNDSDELMNITMIRGQNKGGKSAIIRAIKWALYGDTGDVNEYKNPLDLLNRDAKNNGNFQFSVSFILENNGKRIKITRTMKPTDGISISINRLQMKNIILHFVKNTRRCKGIVCVFCLIQNYILSLSLDHRILNIALEYV